MGWEDVGDVVVERYLVESREWQIRAHDLMLGGRAGFARSDCSLAARSPAFFARSARLPLRRTLGLLPVISLSLLG